MESTVRTCPISGASAALNKANGSSSSDVIVKLVQKKIRLRDVSSGETSDDFLHARHISTVS